MVPPNKHTIRRVTLFLVNLGRFLLTDLFQVNLGRFLLTEHHSQAAPDGFHFNKLNSFYTTNPILMLLRMGFLIYRGIIIVT